MVVLETALGLMEVPGDRVQTETGSDQMAAQETVSDLMEVPGDRVQMEMVSDRMVVVDQMVETEALGQMAETEALDQTVETVLMEETVQMDPVAHREVVMASVLQEEETVLVPDQMEMVSDQAQETEDRALEITVLVLVQAALDPVQAEMALAQAQAVVDLVQVQETVVPDPVPETTASDLVPETTASDLVPETTAEVPAPTKVAQDLVPAALQAAEANQVVVLPIDLLPQAVVEFHKTSLVPRTLVQTHQLTLLATVDSVHLTNSFLTLSMTSSILVTTTDARLWTLAVLSQNMKLFPPLVWPKLKIVLSRRILNLLAHHQSAHRNQEPANLPEVNPSSHLVNT